MTTPGIPVLQHLALVQPRVGIGDMIWHLPHIRALSGRARRVTLVARRRSMAGEIVGPADGVDDIFYVERGQWDAGGRHEGALGMLRLVRDLRALGCDGAVLLTRSRMLTTAAWAAGIGRRHGYGIGSQRRLLRGPFLPPEEWRAHPYRQASAWLALAGVPLDQPEPRLQVSPRDRAAAAQLAPAGGVALGIATSDAWKDWGVANFAGLAEALLQRGWPTVLLIGGPAEQPAATDIMQRLGALAARVRPVLGVDLRTLAGLLQAQAFYVGNDTAALNIAAAVGVRAYGLFGATPALRHSAWITPLVPPGGPSKADGMARLLLQAVLDRIPANPGS